MNPYAILAIVVAFGAVTAWGGVQTYRLQGAQNTIALHEQADEQRRENEQHRQRANTANAGRTNEETRNANARADRVRLELPARPSLPPAVAGSSDDAPICRTRRELDEAVAGWAERERERLTQVARAGEKLATAYRGCKVFVENLE